MQSDRFHIFLCHQPSACPIFVSATLSIILASRFPSLASNILSDNFMLCLINITTPLYVTCWCHLRRDHAPPVSGITVTCHGFMDSAISAPQAQNRVPVCPLMLLRSSVPEKLDSRDYSKPPQNRLSSPARSPLQRRLFPSSPSNKVRRHALGCTVRSLTVQTGQRYAVSERRDGIEPTGASRDRHQQPVRRHPEPDRGWSATTAAVAGDGPSPPETVGGCVPGCHGTPAPPVCRGQEARGRPGAPPRQHRKVQRRSQVREGVCDQLSHNVQPPARHVCVRISQGRVRPNPPHGRGAAMGFGRV
nr:uncharacterized protein LOC125992756 [Syngnathus scovelli]XP_049617765.1 uncharacterized protein LOC125992756 [Syngnathus scovelli]